MTRLHTRLLGGFAVIAGLGLALPAMAADIYVITTDNVMAAAREMQPKFEAATGNKLTFRNQGALATFKLVEGGAASDVVVGSRLMLDKLLAEGKLKPGSIVDIAHSSLGVVVRQGQKAPSISTDAKFKHLLLTVPSIAYPDPVKGSLGGNYFALLLKQWKLADKVNAKAQLTPGGDATGHYVADGKAVIGINQIAEIREVPGLKFLTPLPPALVNKVTMSMAINVQAKQPKAAEQWIRWVASAKGAGASKEHGMVPVHTR
ncbi:MAG TPA: substrate-binding domain-containing protein [Stellaceae bacterium]|nr:substrate-binding domain-containing protein [Stellaceae bacterium]